MLPKHPLVATATAVAAARHSPPPQPRSLRGFIIVVVIVTAVTTVFPPLSCDLFDCCVFVCHRVLAPLSSLLIPKLSPLTDCCVGPGRNGRMGRSPIVVFVLVAADRGGGMSSSAPLSTSVDPVALFDSVAAYKGNNDPSSFPWASSAPSSLVAPSLVDCRVARLLPLSSPSTPAASSRLDLVAPSSVDCRITPSSVDCRVAPLSVVALSRSSPSPLPSSPSLLTSLA